MALPALRPAGPCGCRCPLDVPHTFTYTGDVARALIALGRDERAWGRAWHVPSPPPVTGRELVRRAAVAGGFRRTDRAPVSPTPMVHAAGWFDPFAREFREMRYQFERPFVLDSTHTQEVFGLRPTDLDAALRATLTTPAATRAAGVS